MLAGTVVMLNLDGLSVNDRWFISFFQRWSGHNGCYGSSLVVIQLL